MQPSSTNTTTSSKLTAAQLEQLHSIGSQLQQFRQEQGISLESIAAQTFIPFRLLQAIEAGQANPLPEPIFVQGFIRRYADALGLDGMALAQTFVLNRQFAHPQPLSLAPHLEPTPTQPTPAAESPPLRGRGIVAAAVGLGILMLGGTVYGLQQVGSRSQTPSVTPAQTTAVEQAQSAPDASASVTASPSAPAPRVTPTAAAAAPLKVAMTLTAESWLRVVVDGKTAFEGILPAGTHLDRPIKNHRCSRKCWSSVNPLQ